MRGFFSSSVVVVVVVVLLLCPIIGASRVQPNASTSKQSGQCKSCSFCQIAGIPGSNGVPGVPGNPGYPGKDGTKGEKGSTGKRGVQGPTGIPGKLGRRGHRGFKGERGMGTKGQKGDATNLDPRQLANWKQCAWRAVANTDNGKIKECSFKKLYDNTALRVSYQGNIRVYSHAACNRWCFKFNGNECSGPLPIDSILYIAWSGRFNVLRSHFFEGFCENLPQGKVTVELWVGQCPTDKLGDAYTGYNSVSRIMIEEVPPPQ